MQKQALIKLFLFLTATSQAAPLNAAGNLAARGTKDLLDLKIDLSPVSGLPVTDPGLTRRQNYGTAPSTKPASTTGADEPSYGASSSDVDSASSSDSDSDEPDYGAESDSDSDSDSEAGDDDETEAETDGADSTQKNTDTTTTTTTPAAGAEPSYGASPVDTSAGPINPPFALPPVDLDATADVVTGSGDEEKSTADKPAAEEAEKSTEGETSEPSYGSGAADSQKSTTTAQSTEGETAAAPSYGATDAQKTESGADGESAGAPTYA